MAVLHVLRTAFRANLEEQDDPVLWIAQVLRNNGDEGDILLRGTAAAYAARAQSAASARIAGAPLRNPPDIPRDLTKLVASGARVFAVGEDVAARGLRDDELVPGVTLVPAAELPALVDTYAAVWHW